MSITFAILFYAVVSIWVAVIVHETGHYLAGLIVGVPAKRMRVRIERPPHVALWGGDSWLGPDDERYIEVFRKHAPSTSAAWFFVAGGFLLEAALALGVVWILAGVSIQTALVVLVATTGLLAVYLVVDLFGSSRAGRPTGDLSAMLRISGWWTAVLIVGLLGARVTALLLLL